MRVRHACDEDEHGDARQPGRQHARGKGRLHDADVPVGHTGRPEQLEDEIERKDHEPGGDGRERDRDHEHGRGETQDRESKRRLPDVHVPRPGPPPESALVPEPLRAVDRREERADRADAAARDHVDLDARFVERPENSGVICARRPGSGQDERSAAAWGIGIWRRDEAAVGHSPGSWMVRSLTISNSRVPPGVTTLTVSPTSLLRKARPIGDVVEI